MAEAAPCRFRGREGEKIREIGLLQARMEGEGNLVMFKEDEEVAGNNAVAAEGFDINYLVEDGDEDESGWDLGLGWGEDGRR
ncbi:hypothetical protein ACFX2A_000315 [Malus domestica]